MLETNNVDVYYDRSQALKDITVKVDRGQIVSLIGANGSGKSTLLKTISGIIKPKSGSIMFKGERIEGVDPKGIVKRRLCRVPEGKHLFQKMTVEENLEMGGYLLKDKHRFSAGLDKCYTYFPILGERRKQLAGTLSGGEQQMLAIGRGLMSDPELFLIDEPSLGLAPKIIMKIAEIIYEIYNDGVTIVLVEQNARMALSLSHYAYLLESGKIAMHGKSKDMLEDEHVKHAYLGIKKDRNP